MKTLRILTGLGRVTVIAFALLTSLYALLAFIPFTYQQIHKGGLIPALTAFGRMQAQLYWVALAVACATIWPDFRRASTRRIAMGFAAVHVVAGALLQIFPVYGRLRNDVSSFGWAMAALASLVWLSTIDVIGAWRGIEWAEYYKAGDRRIFRAVLHTAIFVSIVYCCIFYLGAGSGWAASERFGALVAALLSHLLVFGVLFAAINIARSIASVTPWPSRVEFALANLLTAGIGYGIVKTLVFHPVSFEGALAESYAALLAIALVGSIAGLSVRFWTPERGAVDGLGLAMSPLTLPCFRKAYLRPLPLIGLGLVAWFIAVNAAIMDWNYMFQKLGACVVWVLSFAYLYAISPRFTGISDRRITILFWAAMVIPAYRLSAAGVAGDPAMSKALERYAGYDASFRFIRDLLSAPPRDDTFYKFLSQNTNLPRSVAIAPVDVDPAGKISATQGSKPNIFVIVIDSLRRDYLSPYNSKVSFTPGIEAFGKESTVFRNSFTRYGGTGLAEPSIWVGGMLLHKQYVTPFYPMNALAKLTETEGYQSYISMDPILRTIVKPTPDLVELDADRGGMDYRLCSSLEDLEGKLSARKNPERPVFAYTQPQDIHISVINREKNAAIDGDSYGSFYAPYASRIRRFDGCFGNFVQYLKTRGLYENSVVVLTADHGDSLGEEGRWGHAYTLVPEVVRVPLIVHLPKAMESLHAAKDSVVFQSDITPSLYYLLAHKPVAARPAFFGRPLFTVDASEQKSTVRETYLVAASYAAVYGILSDNGKSLYVADAVNYKDAVYDTSDGGGGSGYVGTNRKAESDDLIKKGILEIGAFYKFQPK